MNPETYTVKRIEEQRPPTTPFAAPLTSSAVYSGLTEQQAVDKVRALIAAVDAADRLSLRIDCLPETPVVVWHGGNEYRTAPSCFWTSGGSFADKFDRVRQVLGVLADAGAVELLCDITHRARGARLVAYRFTSDRAYNLFTGVLFTAGAGSLGRGVWRPWSADPGDRAFFDEWFGTGRPTPES